MYFLTVLIWYIYRESSHPLNNAVVGRISREVEKSPAQVILRYLLQNDFVVIPKSSSPERIKANFQVSKTLTAISTLYIYLAGKEQIRAL